ncbi:O-antigen ligase family protein [Psychroserpens mesophilus]|uniref:O-antigen ligase family protein n=1 Tax=Psychroserpens mesophilus TaxID=325473 RepID=UPI003D6484B5
MKILRYIISILLVCNIPGVILLNFGDSMGSVFSYLTLSLLIFFYAINEKHALPWPFIIFALLYYVISGLVYVPDEKYYYIDFIKYVIIIVCGAELARRTTVKELLVLFIIAVSSILINAIFFPMDYGRYSGFFLDPNAAGFACLIGVILTFSIKKDKWKYISLLFFTFCGALTFSRTFILLWVIIILISTFQNRKNVSIFVAGFLAIFLLLSISSTLSLNTDRLNLLDSAFGEGKIDSSVNNDSRTETWSNYYDLIFDSPIVGNGYESFKSDNIYEVGVHNNYLRVIGESGIIPFLIFVGIYFYMLFKSFKTFRTKPYECLLAIGLVIVGLTNHNFDTIHHVTFVSIWLYLRVIENETEEIDHLKNQG